MSKPSPTERQFKAAEKALARMTFSPRRRKAILKRAAQRVIRRSQSNIRRQKDIHGRPFAKRRSGRDDPMLTEMARAKRFRIQNDGHRLRIGYKSRQTGEIAAQHQFGLKSETTAAEVKKRRPLGDRHYDQPATAGQARLLRSVGFKVRRASGRGYQQPSNRWVREHLKVGQAGAIYRELLGEGPKQRWETTPEPRAFFGLTEQQTQQVMVDVILTETEK